MEESRLRIRKTGRIIKGIIFVLKIALVIAIIAGLGIAGSALLDDNVVTDFHDMFEDNNAFLVDMVANLDGVSLKTQCSAE